MSNSILRQTRINLPIRELRYRNIAQHISLDKAFRGGEMRAEQMLTRVNAFGRRKPEHI
jgi:hypothetical protein